MMWLILGFLIFLAMTAWFTIGLCRLAAEATRMEERFLEFNRNKGGENAS